jgi:catechol 2,3-dioxygenase-like lactoylglutathione lyase family enzyme
MITAIHTLIYSDDPEATRAFLRDVLGWPHVEDEASEPGWLIFRAGPSEVGVHPTYTVHEGREYAHPREHVVSLMCDDVEATMRELEAKGARFTTPPVDHGWGIGVNFELPGAGEVMLYQPRHPTAYDL